MINLSNIIKEYTNMSIYKEIFENKKKSIIKILYIINILLKILISHKIINDRFASSINEYIINLQLEKYSLIIKNIIESNIININIDDLTNNNIDDLINNNIEEIKKIGEIEKIEEEKIDKIIEEIIKKKKKIKTKINENKKTIDKKFKQELKQKKEEIKDNIRTKIKIKFRFVSEYDGYITGINI